jgi:hypothetical protein
MSGGLRDLERELVGRKRGRGKREERKRGREEERERGRGKRGKREREERK